MSDIFGPNGVGVAPLGWRPRYVVDPQMMAHVPVLFWFVATRRPGRIHVVGDRKGGGVLALCQALDKTDSVGCCTAQAEWDASTVEALQAAQSQLYPDLLTLDAEPTGPVELILIDARSGLPADWRDNLAPDGVALILGGQVPDGALILPGEDGIGLALVGSDDDVKPIRNPASRLILRRLGEAAAILARREADALVFSRRQKDLERTRSELADARAECDRQGRRLADCGRELASLRETMDSACDVTASGSDDESEQQIAALTTRLEAITAERDALAGQLADSHARAEKLARLEPELRRERDTRFAETAALTRHLEKLARDIQTLTSERDEARARADRQAKAARAAEGRIAELLASTSWRVTRPLRWIKDRGRRG